MDDEIKNLSKKEKDLLIKIGYYYIGSQNEEAGDAYWYSKKLDKNVRELLKLWN